MTRRNLVIVGASLAGAKAAEGARAAGFDGRIVLVGEEPALPYERPALSKDVLRGDKSADSALVHPESFYDDNDVELVTERVTALDLVQRKVDLHDGRSVFFDTAVLATGAAPRRLSIPGVYLDGVHYLRTIQDAVRLHAAIKAATRVAIVGAGWIGSEVAAAARYVGAAVTLVDPARAPMHRLLGDALGGVFAQLHVDNGVDLRMGVGVDALSGDTRVRGVVLGDGTTVEADVVVIGVGVAPRTDLAERAVGLRVNDGIVVDRHLQTSVEGVFAAGDVANAWHPHYQRHLRVEHWANALNQGLIAGRNAAGANETYARLPYFYSDQYDLSLEYVGHHQPGDELVVRGDLDARKFVAFWLRDGCVTAGMNVNVWDVTDDIKSLIAAGAAVDAVRLADPAVPLGEVQRFVPSGGTFVGSGIGAAASSDAAASGPSVPTP